MLLAIFSMSVLHSANNFCKTQINTTITLQIHEVSYCLEEIFFEALLYKKKGKSVAVKVKRYRLSYHSMGICKCMHYCYDR